MIAAALALAYFGYQGAQNVVADRPRAVLAQRRVARPPSWARRSTGQLNVTVNAFMSAVQAAIDDPVTWAGPTRATSTRPAGSLVEGYVIYSDQARAGAIARLFGAQPHP